MKPFDFVKSINSSKQYLITNEVEEKEYNPYIVNMAQSLYNDTIFFANEMNLNRHISNKMQYDYYFHSIRKKNRFSKWPKKLEDDTLSCVMQFYKYNARKAKEVMALLSDEQLQEIKQKLEKGGA